MVTTEPSHIDLSVRDPTPSHLTEERQIYECSDRLGKIHNQSSWEASACSLATASAITRRNHSERLDLLRT